MNNVFVGLHGDVFVKKLHGVVIPLFAMNFKWLVHFSFIHIRDCLFAGHLTCSLTGLCAPVISETVQRVSHPILLRKTPAHLGDKQALLHTVSIVSLIKISAFGKGEVGARKYLAREYADSQLG